MQRLYPLSNTLTLDVSSIWTTIPESATGSAQISRRCLHHFTNDSQLHPSIFFICEVVFGAPHSLAFYNPIAPKYLKMDCHHRFPSSPHTPRIHLVATQSPTVIVGIFSFQTEVSTAVRAMNYVINDTMVSQIEDSFLLINEGRTQFFRRRNSMVADDLNSVLGTSILTRLREAMRFCSLGCWLWRSRSTGRVRFRWRISWSWSWRKLDGCGVRHVGKIT
jgi:hypothetical protein